ncbi:DUF1648 domain-containing protein [Paenibacillus sp. RC67]|uniref:DUF1648 domain-containing protein n=1 Tax=Paenibacillus sp. RC67 TaxID=3039392 RepID=UPI0024ACB72F|nr:DUF1648 domain-containing protein [Paenibacillus sp. RC67]
MENRPVISIAKTTLEKFHNIVSILVLLGTFVYLFSIFSELPEKIPSHFNALGEADRWGGKSSLLLLPSIGVILFVGLTILRKYPQLFNYPREVTPDNAVRQYSNALLLLSWLKFEIMILFSYIEWSMIRSAGGAMNSLGIWFLPVVLIIVLGSVIIFAVRSFRAA